MFVTEALPLVPKRHYLSTQPCIVVGITHPQTCLNLTGRLRTLRKAGFRVILVSSPGELLHRTAAAEGVEAIAIPMERQIAPLADLVSLARLCWLLLRLRAPDGGIQHPQGRAAGKPGSHCFAACPGGSICCAASSSKPPPDSSAGFCWQRSGWPQPARTLCCATARACALKRWRWAWRRRRSCICLGRAARNGVDVVRFSPGPSERARPSGPSSCSPGSGFCGPIDPRQRPA